MCNAPVHIFLLKREEKRTRNRSNLVASAPERVPGERIFYIFVGAVATAAAKSAARWSEGASIQINPG